MTTTTQPFAQTTSKSAEVMICAELGPIRTVSFGSPGAPFGLPPQANIPEPLTALNVGVTRGKGGRWGIAGIQMVYDGVPSTGFGKLANVQTFNVNAGDFIQSVSYRAVPDAGDGNFLWQGIGGLQFHTAEGISSPVYGDLDGAGTTAQIADSVDFGLIGFGGGLYKGRLSALDAAFRHFAVGSAAPGLHLLFFTDGGSSGTSKREIEYETGYKINQEDSRFLSRTVTTEVEAAIKAAVAKASAELKTKYSESVEEQFRSATSTSHHFLRKEKTTLEIDFSRPAYVYQSSFEVKMTNNAGIAILSDDIFVVSRPINLGSRP